MLRFGASLFSSYRRSPPETPDSPSSRQARLPAQPSASLLPSYHTYPPGPQDRLHLNQTYSQPPRLGSTAQDEDEDMGVEMTPRLKKGNSSMDDGFPGEEQNMVDDAGMSQMHRAAEEITRLKQDNKKLSAESVESRSTVGYLRKRMEAFSKQMNALDDFKRDSEQTQAKQASDISNLNAHVADLKEQLVQVTTERDAARAEV
ncbi:hypothetical protein CYLTODRAFT_476436, partial [Cylindrobasidium torrendii FP15055 ss-10]